jgi:endoglucanase
MTGSQRSQHVEWLTALTQVPAAAGREGRVIDWIRGWVGQREEDLAIDADPAGNVVVTMRRARARRPRAQQPPLYITAHLDHPAFVVERIIGPGTVEVSFRGGVMDAFFEDGARIVLHPGGDGRGIAEMPPRAGRGSRGHAAGAIGATLTGAGPGVRDGVFKTYLADLDDGADTGSIAVGDVGTWALLPAEIRDGLLHTWACDDLAGAAAALAAMDVLLSRSRLGEPCPQDVRLLFTRAEEVGFVGAIAACRERTIPRGSRVIALENSRSFPDSPVGGGPIVRVGDRVSVFTPWLTAACARRAEETFARPAHARATEAGPSPGAPSRPWQRRLMAGGACEASVFCAYGYDATCLCLPLGNYHNMPHLAELQAGTYDREQLGPPRAAREYISVEDFHGLVDLLVAIGGGLPPEDSVLGLADRLWRERAFVLGAGADGSARRADGGPARRSPRKKAVDRASRSAGSARQGKPARRGGRRDRR